MVNQAELDALAADYIGRKVAFDDLQQIAQRVTDLYLRRGYYLAQAVLPVQEVVDGVVEISVVEGRLGQVTVQVDPKAPIDEARVRAMLAPLQPGQPLHRERYERRSEEHTSELQSLMRISYAVFCLKKKNKNKHSNQPISYDIPMI